MRSREITLAAMLSALGVVFRVAKNLAIPQSQFVNLPLLFAFVGSHLGGPSAGFLVAALAYLISDLLILPGVWTLADAFLGGLAAALFGFISRGLASVEHRLAAALLWFIARFIAAFLLCFFFDVTSSAVLYVALGLPLRVAIAMGIVGLFFPVMGGSLVGVGPITEFTTALLSALIVEKVSRALGFSQEKS
ncbi:MAG: ECF transporter S component [Thermofilum sp.]|nr:ECF transporter S component [Thermofilum sp.]